MIVEVRFPGVCQEVRREVRSETKSEISRSEEKARDEKSNVAIVFFSSNTYRLTFSTKKNHPQ